MLWPVLIGLGAALLLSDEPTTPKAPPAKAEPSIPPPEIAPGISAGSEYVDEPDAPEALADDDDDSELAQLTVDDPDEEDGA